MQVLRTGTVLQQRYLVQRLIAQGGFGAVYEALDQRLKRRMALKQLVRVSDSFNRQFEREAQLLANLDHPALLRVIDYFNDISGQFLVMDYVPGDDLGVMLEQRGAPFEVDDVLRWADELLDALHYLHTLEPQPIIHRDIKPQNLKFKSNGDIILLDFGLAKGRAGEFVSSFASKSIMAFTRGFAPYEQEQGKGTDGRSDLHALGATLYCLLTVEPVPDAQTRWSNVRHGRGDPIIPAHEINPAVPLAVSEVLHQAMAVRKEDRPADAQTLRAMLSAARRPARSHGRSPAYEEDERFSGAEAVPSHQFDMRADVGPPVIWLREGAPAYQTPSSSSKIRRIFGPWTRTKQPDAYAPAMGGAIVTQRRSWLRMLGVSVGVLVVIVLLGVLVLAATQ